MQLTLTLRDLQPDDLGDLEWSGGPEHIVALAGALQASFTGEVALVVVELANGRLIANGAVDFRRDPDVGRLEMLSVHETFQDLGVGTWLIRALEERVRAAGRSKAELTVEHDNPRAGALYRRLGYREVGSALESWPSGGGTYVTVTTVLQHDLEGPSH
jgi:ribosomal protein S18 acetylase RimI-like enzyme